MNAPVLDLSKRHFEKVDGEVTIIGTWLGATVEESEPCMVMIPTFRALAPGHYKPCVIALSSAYKYDEPKYLMESASSIADILGLGQTATFRIARHIHEHLTDLVAMPPKPVEKQIVMADAIVTDESGRQRTAEIIEEV